MKQMTSPLSTLSFQRRHWILVAMLLSVLSPMDGVSEETYQVTLDKQPAYFAFSGEWHDTNHDRYYKNGVLNINNRIDNNGWLLRNWSYDTRFPWKASVTGTVDATTTDGGIGVVVATGDLFLLFKLYTTTKRYWIGTWKSNGNVWTNVSLAKDGSNYPASEAIRGIGQDNTVEVSAHNGTYTFNINGVEVASFTGHSALSTFNGSVAGLGLLYAGNSIIRLRTFSATYTSKNVPYDKDAFIGVRKSLVQELKSPSSRFPVMSPNGQQLYNVRSDSSNADDIWVANATSDSTWSPSISIGPPLNNAGSNSVVSVSQDGNELVIWGQYNADGSSKSGGFSLSRRTATGWSVPTDIVTNHAPNKSSTREECMSSDRHVAILARQIEGNTTGEKDLYVSFRQADGSYGPLLNLGTDVNTPGGEHGPFLAADSRTLYWYSDYETFGQSDIFVSKRLDDTWLRWSKRVNLGPTINSSEWDAYFCIHPSGKYAYMNTSDGYNTGICRIDLPSDSASRRLLPDPVVIVKGRVLNAKTKQPLGVDIRYDDLATGANLGTAVSEPVQGRYSIVLTGGKNYGFYAKRDGFFPVSENLELTDLQQYQVIERDLYLEPIEIGSNIRLNNLFFDTDKSDLRPESRTELDRLVDLLNQFPQMSIRIEGHTDDRGSDAHNNTLSKNRAQSVLAYLTSKGVTEGRLKAVGLGESKPKAPNTTDEARQLNRRVEFSITAM